MDILLRRPPLLKPQTKLQLQVSQTLADVADKTNPGLALGRYGTRTLRCSSLQPSVPWSIASVCVSAIRVHCPLDPDEMGEQLVSLAIASARVFGLFTHTPVRNATDRDIHPHYCASQIYPHINTWGNETIKLCESNLSCTDVNFQRTASVFYLH